MRITLPDLLSAKSLPSVSLQVTTSFLLSILTSDLFLTHLFYINNLSSLDTSLIMLHSIVFLSDNHQQQENMQQLGVRTSQYIYLHILICDNGLTKYLRRQLMSVLYLSTTRCHTWRYFNTHIIDFSLCLCASLWVIVFWCCATPHNTSSVMAWPGRPPF